MRNLREIAAEQRDAAEWLDTMAGYKWAKGCHSRYRQLRIEGHGWIANVKDDISYGDSFIWEYIRPGTPVSYWRFDLTGIAMSVYVPHP